MKVLVNGEAMELEPGTTVRDLLAARSGPGSRLGPRLGPRGGPCAVEVNERLVPRARHEETFLKDGDRIEIVTLVGGG